MKNFVLFLVAMILVAYFLALAWPVTVTAKTRVADPLFAGLGVTLQAPEIDPLAWIVRLFQELVALPIKAAMQLKGG